MLIKDALHRLVILLFMVGISFYGYSMPQLPEPELSWKNVTVDGKRLRCSVCLMTVAA